jgi:hypothetical protein
VFGEAPSPSSTIEGVEGGVAESTISLQRLPILQAGGTDCAWAVEGDGSFRNATVTILPGIEASDWPGAPPGSPYLAAASGWGEAAYVGCGPAEGYRCGYVVLIGSTWLDVRTYATVGDVAALAAASEPFARAVVAQIQGAGEPLPLWVHPGSEQAPDCATLVPDGSTLPSIGAVEPSPDLAGYLDPVSGAAARQIGASACAYNSIAKVGYASVTILPGTAWAWESHPPASNGSLSLSPEAGVGSDARSGCSTIINYCLLHVITGDGAWLAVEVSRPDDQPRVDLKAIAEQVLAAL